VPAAGSPKYLELFGRDPLITGMQSAFVSPEILRGILTELPKWQGTRRDDWRDEAPGRLIHQVQEDPLSRLCYGPLGRYYGSLSAPALYAEGLFAHWAWTGDSEEARRFIAPALKAMRWLETTAENDKDRFYAYYTRSEQGVKNQSWKDSGDAIVYEDGSLVPDPIATSEMQGVAYSAKLHLGFLLSRLGEKALGIRLQEEARELQKRFNDHFWMEPEGYFALGKDSQGRLIRSISSDPGACLASGIVDEGLAKRTADRLMKPDLFSGWGVRTLSSDHPAYDPFSYHRGSVWPVENAFIALGFRRYGFREYGERLLRAQFEAASLFDYCRLPEVFSGHPRSAENPFPVPYLEATWPQAWSASAVLSAIQILLGLFPFAPQDTLFVDPSLPEWLPELTLNRLRVGKATVSIRFFRGTDGESGYEIVEADGKITVSREKSPLLKILGAPFSRVS
jgi:glycogen debranching enzyme